jgi:hypothetical protein
MLTAVLASGLIGIDRLHSSQVASTHASSSQQNAFARGVLRIPACGDQLGIAGFGITLSTMPNAAQVAQAALGLSPNDIASEFLPLTSTSPALDADPAAQALALGRMRIVNVAAMGPMSQSALLAKLQSASGVVASEPIWLQSTDKRYLACGYRLQDNSTDQALAAIARQALVTAGIGAATLDDTATMEFVSLRHFNRRQLLQVAFVRRPIDGPSVAYVALLDPVTRAVLATVQANWYRQA